MSDFDKEEVKRLSKMNKARRWFNYQNSCPYVSWVRVDVITKKPTCKHPLTKLNECKLSQCPIKDDILNKNS